MSNADEIARPYSVNFFSESGFYDGKHKINTADDLHLIAVAPPVIVMPKQKTKYLDVPGANGKLDLSELLTGGPIFENREGSIEFYTARGYKRSSALVPMHEFASWEWFRVFARYIHGQRLKMVLETDLDHYYEGRFEVEYDHDDSMNRGKITVNYDLAPYRTTCVIDGETITDMSGAPDGGKIL